MGLDMYLFKVRKLSSDEDKLFRDKTIEDAHELNKKYSIWKDTDSVKAPAAIKKVGTPIKIKEEKFNIVHVFKDKFPNRKEEDIVNFESEKTDTGIILYYFVKDRQEPLVVDFLANEFSKYIKVFYDSAYICNEDEVFYWRKANQIRAWLQSHLEEGVENCEYSTITKENAEALIKDCDRVLKNRSLASKVMPTSAGFFFGGTNYDEYYFEDLMNTSKKLKELLKTYDDENEAFLYSEWW